MKKSILIAALLFVGLYTNVLAGLNPGCYVKSGDKTFFGRDLKIGAFIIKITSENGSVVRVPLHKVQSYSDGFRLFEFLPTVNENNDTTEFRFMEYVTSKNGFKLFSFYNPELENPGREYYVFTSEKMHLKLDNKNAASVFAFFEIKPL